MEEASEAERTKASRPYDGMAQFSEQHKQLADQLLTTAATLERGYQAFRGSGNRQVFQPQVNEMGKLHRQWLSDLENFKNSLRAQGAEPMVRFPTQNDHDSELIPIRIPKGWRSRFRGEADQYLAFGSES